MSRNDAFARITAHIDPAARLIRHWPLEGGVSALTEAMEIALPNGATACLVVRRYSAEHENVDAIATEHALLKRLHEIGFSVPEPRHLDVSASVLPEPLMVMGFIEGSTDVAPDVLPDALPRMADTLIQLHSLNPAELELPSLPLRTNPMDDLAPLLTESPLHQRIREACNRAAPITSSNAPVLLHGDFWPGNLLWRDDRIVAVVDWEDAAIGDPAADLAGSRLEILWKYGSAEMEAFTRHYLDRQPIDTSTLPFWEIMCATGGLTFMGDWGLDPATEQTMRQRGSWLIEDALKRLGGS